MSGPVDQLRSVIEAGGVTEQSLVVANRTEVDPIQRLLETTFAEQSVDIDETELDSVDDDTVLLLRDGELVATSPLQGVIDSCLLVNSDRYRTGAGGVDRWQAPAVITQLDETVFRLRGFPASVKEKLILILISRYIEVRALRRGEGVLRATFQRLSRLGEENGTREVYRRLGETAVSVHVYGVDDWEPSEELAIQRHTGDHPGYRQTWCVVFRPPEPTGDHVAMVALETGRNEWLGTWTYDAEKVRQVDDILVESF